MLGRRAYTQCVRSTYSTVVIIVVIIALVDAWTQSIHAMCKEYIQARQSIHAMCKEYIQAR